ncbi:unnamed protein product [Mesocestoides corti]|uniref:Adenylate kinase 9 n=1 Tax=Mesocestoides corti TaxID=53468 RepID=A0A158QU24_MESCO|nr:unnamed protein product [Mesocestoides corti]
MFFLSSREALNAFTRNPRPYLGPIGVLPRAPVRIAVVGYLESGARSLCRLIADRHHAVWISLTDLLRKEHAAKRAEMRYQVRTQVEASLIEQMISQRRREVDAIVTSALVDNALSDLTTQVVNDVAESTLENLLPPRSEDKSSRLKEEITPDNPEIVEEVTRAIRFANASPNYLEPKVYVDALVQELERLDYENRNVPPLKRRQIRGFLLCRPLNWVIEGIPPLPEVWQDLVQRSKAVASEVKSVREAVEKLHTLEQAAKRAGQRRGGDEEEEEEAKDEEGLMEDGGNEKDESENPYAKTPSPRLVAARQLAEEANAKVIPPDPMPSFVFKLKDALPDNAFLIHKLYTIGFGPLEGLPALPKTARDDMVSMEPMAATETADGSTKEKTQSKAKADDDDSVTEPPEDPPGSNQAFDPMPQPGPEVDCVRDQLVRFDAAWETSKQAISGYSTAYDFPVRTQEILIRKNTTLDNIYDEVNEEFEKLFRFAARETSQDELDEAVEAESEGFDETGGLEDNPALKDALGEEGEEGGEENEEEQEEGAEEEAEEEGASGEEGEESMQEEDPSRGTNRRLGQTSYFCPVAYHELRILKPGDPEMVVTYKGLVYYLSDEKERDKFLADPEKYVGGGHQGPLKPPPLRIVLLGPTGTGKTLHGRQLACRLDVIHVSFNQLLQDVMMAKLKKNIGPEYVDDVPIPVKVMPDLEAAVAKALLQMQNPEDAVEAAEPEAVEQESDATPDGISPHDLAIREFLENDEPLPQESLNLLVARLWHEEPYRSRGFILEGFPRTTDDVTYMVESNLYFDFAIVLNAETDDVIPRLLPARLAKWKVKMSKIKANKQIEAEWNKKKRQRIREERRKMIIKSINEKRMAKYKQGGDDVADENLDENNELDDEVNVDELLDEELPEEEAEEMEDEENEESAVDRITEDITERVENETENVESVLEELTEAKIPHYSVRANDRLTRVRYRLIKKIKNLIINREAIFERVYPVTLEEAENLVASGFKHLSLFGRFCPVTWSRVSTARLPPRNPSPILRYSVINQKALERQLGDEIDPTVGKKVKKGPGAIKTCAAVYRECVYWFDSESERKTFTENPIAIINAAGDQARTLLHQPLRVAIIGSPSTERSNIAKRLATHLNVAYVTTPAVVRWFLSSTCQSWTHLANEIKEIMLAGNSLPDSVVAQVLKVALIAPQIQSRGYILDGFPITSEQAQYLTSSPIRPILTLELYKDQFGFFSTEVSRFFDNWNNQDPQNCPFLQIWSSIRSRRGQIQVLEVHLVLGEVEEEQTEALTGSVEEVEAVKELPEVQEEMVDKVDGVVGTKKVVALDEKKVMADVEEEKERERGPEQTIMGKVDPGSGRVVEEEEEEGVEEMTTVPEDQVEGEVGKGGGASGGSGGEYDDGTGKGRSRDKAGRQGGRGKDGLKSRKGKGGEDSNDDGTDDDNRGSRKGRRGRGGKGGEGGESDDDDGSGGRGGRRGRKKGGEDDDDDGGGGGGGGGGKGSQEDGSDLSGKKDEEDDGKRDDWGVRQGQSLEELYGIPGIECDTLERDIIKHVAHTDSDGPRRESLALLTGLQSDIPTDEAPLASQKKSLLLITHRMAHVQEYASTRKRNTASSISEMGVTTNQVYQDLGEFGDYCPVRLAEHDELFDCLIEHTAPLETRLPGVDAALPNANYFSAFASTSWRYLIDDPDADLQPRIHTDLRFAVEYRGRIYRTAGPEELQKFMANPEKYTSPNAPRALPAESDLPRLLPAGSPLRASFPTQISLRGFCPVCFQESGLRYEGLRMGNRDILAKYQGLIYAFCSEDCRTKFMHRPSRFGNLKLPHKLPPMNLAISVDDLPLPGYLEQTVAYALRTALAMCAQFRPKYPFLTPERSALIYMALQLMAVNPQSPEYLKERARRRVERFERSCLLIEQLAATMPLTFVEERKRPHVFARKLQEFLSLQGQEDNEDVWVSSV